MSKRFPFTKRTIEALSSHDPDSKSREAEYSDSESTEVKAPINAAHLFGGPFLFT